MGLEEIWKPIFGYEDRYEVSNLGKVRNIKTHQTLRGEPTKDRYIRVRLWNGERYKSRMIHCLVAETFIPLPNVNNQYEVDHIDNNVTNNVVTNLQWLTHAENLNKSFELNHQLRPKRIVYQFSLDGQLICQYESVNEAFRRTNIRHISECANKKQKTAGGYIWRYSSVLEKE